MAELVMVGAGPQALTLSCLLLQKLSRLQRRLRIVDPSGRWLSRWQRQMERYEIPWLRSPSPHKCIPDSPVTSLSIAEGFRLQAHILCHC